MSQERVTVFDTTLRDGEQSPGCSMNLLEKVRMAVKLQELGVDIIEAAFPIASEGDFVAVQAVAAECRNVTVAALCRTADQDVARAADALSGAAHPRIHTFVATSDIHLEHKLKKTRSEVIEMTRAAVQQARTYVDEVEFSAEDATRSHIDYLCDVLDVAVDAGASILNIPDTVGYTTPGEFISLISTVKERVVRDRDVVISVHCQNDPGLGVACTTPGEFISLISSVKERVVRDRDVVISVHCHNDLGLAVANTLAALGAGARQVECTINGIGERAGNAELEEIVMAMRVRADRLPFETGINTSELYPASQLLSSIVGFEVPTKQAALGRSE